MKNDWKKKIAASPALRAFIAIIGLAVLLEILKQKVYWLFAYPAAWLAGIFWGIAPRISINGDVYLPLTMQGIQITQECCGLGFFTLVFGMWIYCLGQSKGIVSVGLLVFSIISERRKTSISTFVPLKFFKSVVQTSINNLMGLVIAFGITIVTNSLRIVSGFIAYRWTESLLPNNFQAVIHQAVGIITFLSILILCSIFFERIQRDVKFYNFRENQHSSELS